MRFRLAPRSMTLDDQLLQWHCWAFLC